MSLLEIKELEEKWIELKEIDLQAFKCLLKKLVEHKNFEEDKEFYNK